MRSPPFRWRRSGSAPSEAQDAVSSLAALEGALVDEGWELVEQPPDPWFAHHFRRPLVPLMQRIAPYRAEGALIAFVEPGSAPEPPPERRETQAEPAEAARLEAERLEAERLEAERLEAERLEAEQLEATRVEAERLEIERLEAERLEAERLEAERLEAERLEAERLEAKRIEAERLEAERAEAERLEAERAGAERLEAERAEAERLAAEQPSPLQDLISSYSAGYDGRLDVRRIYGAESAPLDSDRLTRRFRRRRR
jgi:hypothetical protein